MSLEIRLFTNDNRNDNSIETITFAHLYGLYFSLNEWPPYWFDLALSRDAVFLRIARVMFDFT